MKRQNNLRLSGPRRIASNQEFLRWAVEKEGRIRMRIAFSVRDPIVKEYYTLHGSSALLQFRTPGSALEMVRKLHEMLDFLSTKGRWPEFT